MKIAYIYDQSSGGIPNLALLTCSVLADLGHQVLACGPSHDQQFWARNVGKHGVKLEIMSWRGFLSLPARICRVIAEFNPQVILSTHRGCDIRTSRFAKRKGISHVIVMCDSPLSLETSHKKSILLLKLRDSLWLQALSYAEKVICISQYSAEGAKSFGVNPNKINYIPCAIPLEDYSWAKIKNIETHDSPVKLLSVGRFSPEKNPYLLVELLSKLRKDGCNATATWIGQGSDKLLKKTKNLAKRRGLLQFIRLIKKVPYVAPYYRDANIFVHFRTDEGFGLVLAEAQASGLPVVAFRSGSVPEVVKDEKTGLLCDPLRIDQMAANVQKLISDPDRYKAISHASIERARRLFSPEKFGADYEDTIMNATCITSL